MCVKPISLVCVCFCSLAQTMEGRLSVLIDECGVSDDEQLGALIVRTPSLLHTPLGQIRSRAEWLVSSGVVESGSRPKERSTLAALRAVLEERPMMALLQKALLRASWQWPRLRPDHRWSPQQVLLGQRHCHSRAPTSRDGCLLASWKRAI